MIGVAFLFYVAKCIRGVKRKSNIGLSDNNMKMTGQNKAIKANVDAVRGQ